MSKKKKITIAALAAVIAAVLLIVCICIFSQKTGATNAATVYEKTIATYFGEIDVSKLRNTLPNSIFTIQCGEEQMSDFFLKANDKQMINILKVKNEFSKSATDLQFYVFDEHFAMSSNKLFAGHLYGIDTEVVDIQLQDSSLLGMQGINAEDVLKNNQEKLDYFRRANADLWRIGQNDVADLTGLLTDGVTKETETSSIETHKLTQEQARGVVNALFGTQASTWQYVAKHTEYILLNDDLTKYNNLLETMYWLADFIEFAENSNEVIFEYNNTAGLMQAIKFTNPKSSTENFVKISFEQANGKNIIRFTAKDGDEVKVELEAVKAGELAYTITHAGQNICSGEMTETTKDLQTEVKIAVETIFVNESEKTANVSFSFLPNMNEVAELPAYINVTQMDSENAEHFFEMMGHAIGEGYDEMASIFLHSVFVEDETDYIDVPTANIHDGEIVFIDDERVVLKIVKLDTEIAAPALVFEMTNKTDVTLGYLSQSMLIQNTTIDYNSGITVPAGETITWAIPLTKDFLSFDLEEIDKIYFPNITVSTEEDTLYSIKHTVEFKKMTDIPPAEHPDTLVYDSVRFKVYAEKDITITEDGIQTTVYFVNNSSRNIYIDIDAGIVNDIRGECIDYFPCYANTTCKKTFTIKGDFAAMKKEDIAHIYFELLIRDRDHTQLTGLQSMEISFA